MSRFKDRITGGDRDGEAGICDPRTVRAGKGEGEKRAIHQNVVDLVDAEKGQVRWHSRAAEAEPMPPSVRGLFRLPRRVYCSRVTRSQFDCVPYPCAIGLRVILVSIYIYQEGPFVWLLFLASDFDTREAEELQGAVPSTRELKRTSDEGLFGKGVAAATGKGKVGQ